VTTEHDEAIEVTSEVEQEGFPAESVDPTRTDDTEVTDGAGSEPGADVAEGGLSVQGALNVSEHELKPALEAVLMIADTPLDQLSLAQAVGATPDAVETALAELSAEYTEQGRGFDLRMAGAGWRFYTREEFAPIIEQFVVDGQQARLTQAALETLAVVAYRQPVSRARVSAIRGVNVDGVMRTLLNRGLVEEAGSDQETGAHLYRTTSYFLERMGLTSLEQLPEIAPLLPEMEELDDAADFDDALADS
jgi:segregation and condensation protein B